MRLVYLQHKLRCSGGGVKSATGDHSSRTASPEWIWSCGSAARGCWSLGRATVTTFSAGVKRMHRVRQRARQSPALRAPGKTAPESPVLLIRGREFDTPSGERSSRRPNRCANGPEDGVPISGLSGAKRSLFRGSQQHVRLTRDANRWPRSAGWGPVHPPAADRRIHGRLQRRIVREAGPGGQHEQPSQADRALAGGSARALVWARRSCQKTQRPSAHGLECSSRKSITCTLAS